MPKIFPSLVRQLIEQELPALINEANKGEIGVGLTETIVNIVSLIREIPDVLLSPPPEVYLELSWALVVVEQANEIRISRGTNSNLRLVKGKNCVWIMHNALCQCPDEFPRVLPTNLAFLADPELEEEIRRDIGEVERALSNSEWKAATVLAGAAIEALLLRSLSQSQPADVEREALLYRPANKWGKADHKVLDTWALPAYIAVCSRLKLIDSETVRCLELAKDFRNLIHPGRALGSKQACNRDTAHISYGALCRLVFHFGGSLS